MSQCVPSIYVENYIYESDHDVRFGKRRKMWEVWEIVYLLTLVQNELSD